MARYFPGNCSQASIAHTYLHTYDSLLPTLCLSLTYTGIQAIVTKLITLERVSIWCGGLSGGEAWYAKQKYFFASSHSPAMPSLRATAMAGQLFT